MLNSNVLSGPVRPQTPFTTEQLAGINSTSAATVINSGPGGGKSSILKEIVWQNPSAKILYLAYNKSIVEDMRGSLPPNCEVSTFHAFGLKTIKSQQKYRGERLKVDFNKYRKVDPKYGVSNLVQSHIALGGGLSETSYAQWKETCDRFQLDSDMITDARKCLELANEDNTIISAQDMLTLPVREDHSIPTYDIVLIDECQDLGVDKLMLLHQIPTYKIFLVGDKNQMINGWAGTDPEIFQKLDEFYSPVKYMVNETFRCPAEIIAEANKYVNSLYGSKPEGLVMSEYYDNVSSFDIPDESLILCRANAPLLRMAKMLIRDKVDFKIKPQAIKTMGSIIKRLVKGTGTNIHALRVACRDEQRVEIENYKKKKWNPIIPEYKYDAVMEILSAGTSLAAAETLVKQLLATSNIGSSCKRQLSSIHASKGLESPNVFYLERAISDRAIEKSKPGWSRQEEKNLCYVGITRSMKNLVFVNR